MCPEGSEPLLHLEEVTSGYGPIVAVREATLEVHSGEIVALLGANGAGKSTLLKTICGLVQVSSGSITLAGERVDHQKPDDIVRRGVGFVPEGRRIFGRLTVSENLRIGAVARRNKTEISGDMEEMYQLFPILGQRRKQLAGTLSGGEQQMLAVARSLMTRPRLMLLDEPSLGLAPRIVAQIFAMLRELPNRGITALLVEQNAELALGVASRAYLMASGVLQFSGTASEIRGTVNLEMVYLGDGELASFSPSPLTGQE